MLLQGKVALITGAASERGIGRATAEIFAQQGAKVIIVDLDLAQSQNAAKALGEGHLGLAANVANEEQVKVAVEQALQHYGKIDILINNAGITQPVKTLDIQRNDYDRIFRCQPAWNTDYVASCYSIYESKWWWKHCVPIFSFSTTRRWYFWRATL